MYGARPVADAVRYWKARLTNVLAAKAPALYVRYTGETGRGRKPATPAEVAQYFARSAAELDERLGVDSDPTSFWACKSVLEYGPGDCPGLALHHLARGAARVVCVDRFPLARGGTHRTEILAAILNTFHGAERRRADAAFVKPGDPASGFNSERLSYLVKADGCSDLRAVCDVVHSRAVLEHVHDLGAAYADAARALKPGGVAIHLVDLGSHGLHDTNPLDFLTWPEAKWNRMYDAKGSPNRHRLDVHRALALAAGLVDVRVAATEFARPEDVAAARPYLDVRFRTLSDETLSVLGFWIRGAASLRRSSARRGPTPAPSSQAVVLVPRPA